MKTTKVCGKCREELDFSMFSRNNSKASGYQSYCKACAHPLRTQWASENRRKVRGYRLKYTYGLSHETFELLLTEQGGKCKICKEVFDKTPNIDHDHSCCGPEKACSNCVRGLLCHRCNIFIGFLENYEYMEEVKTYLGLTNEAEQTKIEEPKTNRQEKEQTHD